MGLTQPTTAPIDASARWENVARELRTYHGVWRLVAQPASYDAAKTLASSITRGRYTAFRPAYHYQGTTNGDREVKAIYHGPSCRRAVTQGTASCSCPISTAEP